MLKYLCFIFTLLTSSCIFKPLYQNAAIKELSLVEFANPTTILDAKINQELGMLFYTEASMPFKYKLTTNITCKYLDSIILSNSDIIEQTISMQIDYTLSNKNSGTPLLCNSFTVKDELNNSVRLYTASVNANKTKNHLIDAAAKQIEQDLILFFLNSNETIYK